MYLTEIGILANFTFNKSDYENSFLSSWTLDLNTLPVIIKNFPFFSAILLYWEEIKLATNSKNSYNSHLFLKVFLLRIIILLV